VLPVSTVAWAMSPPSSSGDTRGVLGVVQYPANDPLEDRFAVRRLDVIGAWWFAVFDGHGGWQCSDYVSKTLHRNLEIELGNRLGLGHEENDMLGSRKDPGEVYEGKVHERLVSGALVAAFERTDRVYQNKVAGAFEVGFGRDTRAGSCALGALLVDGTLFLANLGDSRAVLGVVREAYSALSPAERRAPRPQGASDEEVAFLLSSSCSSHTKALYSSLF